MRFMYRPARSQAQIDEPYARMRAEGLLPYAMYAFADPGLEDWRRVTAPEKGLLLRCEDAQGRLLACGLFSPLLGKIWQFDFTAFRESAHLAPLMARQAFAWIFDRQDCAGIMGLCPAPNRHAWRLAEAVGFNVLGRLPKACFYARKQNYVDGVLVLCTPRSLASATSLANGDSRAALK
ncbi:hypothetical protein [Desulfovibrio sp. ZJ200]|uniref:hypothetical protein n=1 Tax=Desulfovibrio sp. ZJ200 TaxID=2709792 RepID=UPI0013E9D5FA|nr:hypothetical protein [Desulfovibrio sp. ZJ200]